MRQCKPLNNSQFAIVVMMCEMLKNKRGPHANRIADFGSQVMIQIPAGLGKSHVICGLAMNLSGFDQIVIIYSSALLLQAEAAAV